MDIFDKMTPEEEKCFDRHYTRCDFDDECCVCDNPQYGSYAIGYNEYTGEVDDYICGKCALKGISVLVKYEKQKYDK